MAIPQVARSYRSAQLREMDRAMQAVRRQWARMGRDFDTSYTAIELPLLTVMYTAQGRVASAAREYVPRVMRETGFRDVPDRDFDVPPEAWAGTAGDGRTVAGLAHQSVVQAKIAVGTGLTAETALQRSGAWLLTAMTTVLVDTARGMERTDGAARRVRAYMRTLSPGACGRCVILAGRVSTVSEAFLRHPGCQCTNIPASADFARDEMQDPHSYLESLSDEDLARTLGSKANAEAYREYGADVNQLVNAYRKRGDVRPAQIYGRNIKFTTEGTTRRGFAYSRMAQADYVRAQGERKRSGQRNISLRAPRLMPESILGMTADRAERVRLLRLYGWVD